MTQETTVASPTMSPLNALTTVTLTTGQNVSSGESEPAESTGMQAI